jgi:hypothetical protein
MQKERAVHFLIKQFKTLLCRESQYPEMLTAIDDVHDEPP